MADALNIATARRYDAPHWKQTTITWDDFMKKAQRPLVLNSKSEVGCYVFGLLQVTDRKHRTGPCRALHRTKEAVVSRDALTLDVDHPLPSFRDDLAEVVLNGVAHVVHTTYSSTPEAPRYRVVIPLSRSVSPGEFQRLSRYLMRRLGGEWDTTCAQPERLMFLPSTPDPDNYWHRIVAGEPLNVGACLLDAGMDEPDATPAGTPVEVPSDAPPAPAQVIEQAVQQAVRDLQELAALGPGQRTSQGLGWEENGGVVKAAALLVRAGNSGFGLDAAQKVFWEHAPIDGHFTEEHCEAKWEWAVETVGAGRLGSDPASDFEVLPAEQVDEQRASHAGGWLPVDLDRFADGYCPPETSLMRRSDGLALLYPGMTHSIHGESESGKSMLIQAEVAVQLKAGSRVLYLDYEADPGSVVERLRLMGVGREALPLLDYVQPEMDYSRMPEAREAFDRLLSGTYALAVVDGVTEALSQAPALARSTAGLGGNDDITLWHDRLPRLLSKRTGAAVVVIDHVAKNTETAGRFAIGGQAKMSTVSGAAYLVRPVSPLGREMLGRVNIYVAKDRHGHVRGHAGAFDKDRLQIVATAIVDGTGGGLSVRLNTPAVDEGDRLGTIKVRISEFLSNPPESTDPKAATLGLSKTAISEGVKGKTADVRAALDELVESGHVVRTLDGVSTMRHRLVKPYTPEFEPEVSIPSPVPTPSLPRPDGLR